MIVGFVPTQTYHHGEAIHNGSAPVVFIQWE